MRSFQFIVLTSVIVVVFFSSSVLCWSSEDLELFDLVESTDEIFYNVLGVDRKASANDIRKAYRRLSIQYHPDKNKEDDAEERFRKIAAIADVLRNEERRKKYDLILQTGLPDWRQPIYYYRQVRNMGIWELMVFLVVLLTIGQYLLAWAAYWEKKYEIEEVVLSRLRKKAKHQRKGKTAQINEELEVAEIASILPKPKYQDLFPVRLTFFLVHLLRSTPCYIKSCKDFFCSKTSGLPAEQEDSSDEDEPREVRVRNRKHIKPFIPDYSGLPSAENAESEAKPKENGINYSESAMNQKNISSGYFTEADFQELKKLMKKYPNGTLQRWEKIADVLKCSPADVVFMAKQMKSLAFTGNVPIAMQGLTGMDKNSIIPTAEISNGYSKNVDAPICAKNGKVCTSSSVEVVANGTHHSTDDEQKNKCEKAVWMQEQQRAFEAALQKYPKDTKARWDRIAESVPGKTKEECIIRYKELATQIKKKKNKGP